MGAADAGPGPHLTRARAPVTGVPRPRRPATCPTRPGVGRADDPTPRGARAQDLIARPGLAGRGPGPARPATSSASSSTPRTSTSSPPGSAARCSSAPPGCAASSAPGPMRMNRAVVIRAAAGLAAYLRAKGQADGLVVIGYDARYKSADFAHDTAAVMVGAGLRAAVLPRPLPTPVLAFAIRHLGAAAGVRSPPATTRRATTATRSTSATAPRSCRPPTPRSPPRSTPSAPLDDVPRAETRLGHPRRRGPGRLPGAYGRRADRRLPRAPPASSTRPCTASAGRR